MSALQDLRTPVCPPGTGTCDAHVVGYALPRDLRRGAPAGLQSGPARAPVPPHVPHGRRRHHAGLALRRPVPRLANLRRRDGLAARRRAVPDRERAAARPVPALGGRVLCVSGAAHRPPADLRGRARHHVRGRADRHADDEERAPAPAENPCPPPSRSSSSACSPRSSGSSARSACSCGRRCPSRSSSSSVGSSAGRRDSSRSMPRSSTSPRPSRSRAGLRRPRRPRARRALGGRSHDASHLL